MSHVVFEAEVQARAEHPCTDCAHAFQEAFQAWPDVEAQAPGRVQLLGGLADGNEALVLAAAIPQQTRVAMRRNGRAAFRLYAAELRSGVEFTLEARPDEAYASYVYGCLQLLRDEGNEIPPLDIHVASEVPMGMGLASSAALEVATLRCLRELLGLDLDDVRVAELAQQAEIRYAGVGCALVDHLACSLASAGRALLLDTRSLAHRLVPLPQGCALLVLDSGVPPTGAASANRQRRAECAGAARLLDVHSLRDVEQLERIEALPDLPRRRARHVHTENARVLQAAECRDPQAFGALMNASHASLRDDYEASTPELDLLVQLLQEQPGVYGARLTGCGFGGACVALCADEAVHEAAHCVLERYAQAGHRGKRLVPAGEGE